MHKKLIFVLVPAMSFLLFVVASGEVKHKYEGVKVCGMCHKGEAKGKILEKWQASEHATAYKTLESPESQKIAKSKGLKKSAAESAQCLECHVTAFKVNKSLLGPKFDMKDGVQCEACHGPGSDYKSMAAMKDVKKAVENGLVLGKGDEKLCIKCHNKKSPTFKAFDYKKDWAKIAHPVKG
jgi:hypothetical protein